LKVYGDLDSKFRFVILASKRAKQLLQGAKPKIKSKSKNLIQVAQKEVKQRLIDYEIVQPKAEEFHGTEDEAFIGEELGIVEEGILKEKAQKKAKDKAEDKAEKKSKKKATPEKKTKTSKTKTTKKKSSKKE
jgi:DNA-directed RNA polymerase subunit K/omega